ncbi:MAG: hypothetical protein WCP30_19315, partial [Mycobacteriaceae bacterium]
LEGRSERPATGMGSPEPMANREDTQVENLCYRTPPIRSSHRKSRSRTTPPPVGGLNQGDIVMRTQLQQQTGRGVAVLALGAIMAAATVAQAGPPSLSTNPGNLAIFPARSQTPEQQRQDEAAAYDWATQQTRWDPYQAKAQLDQQSHAATDAAGAARGGAVRGAAGGALLGAAVGAIGGDAGKGAAMGSAAAGLTGGMRSRRAVKTAGGSADAATAAYQQQFSVWNRNFMAAMEAKGYTVR